MLADKLNTMKADVSSDGKEWYDENSAIAPQPDFITNVRLDTHPSARAGHEPLVVSDGKEEAFSYDGDPWEDLK